MQTRLLSALALALAFPSVYASERPNVVLILCDDLGYGDLGIYGSETHRTPRIDQLASEGVRYTRFYIAAPVCTPSRAALMTGSYPKRVGLHENEKGGWVLFPGNARGIREGELTMAEVLRSEGYATHCVGKWHLGDQPPYLPTEHGFQGYFGIPYSNDMGNMTGAGVLRPRRGYPPLPLLRDDRIVEIEPDQREITRRYTQEAISFIHRNQDRPFFLYLPHTMPHAPQFASETFAGKSANGDWGDTVEEIDWSTGLLLDTLDELGLKDNTIVMFLSDNGGATHWGASSGVLRGSKGTVWEGGFRTPFIVRWPARLGADQVSNHFGSAMDILPTLMEALDLERSSDSPRIDGQSILSSWLNPTEERDMDRPFFYYFRGDIRAVRLGPWKLHLALEDNRRLGRERGPRDAELYHLEADIGETNDVASERPEIVKRLQGLADEMAQDLGALGTMGPGARPAGMVENPVPLRL